MSRLIDADALIEKYIVVIRKAADEKLKTEIAVLLKDIEAQPTIDAVPVRHGKWIPHEDEDGEHYGDKCSECGEWYVMPYGKTNFCPHCGARMDNDGK